jgi:hypothetical protein
VTEDSRAASAATPRWWSLEGRAMGRLSWLLLAICCAPPLYLRFLPMVDLPQYVAASRILMHLHDPAYGFAPFYKLAFAKAPAVVTLYLLGGLSWLTSLDAATRVVTFLSVALYPLGLCALLRAQGKPIALALLGLPLVYASPFFWGLLPSSLSAGLAWIAIALLISARNDRASRIGLLALCTMLPLTHAFGVAIVVGYAATATLTRTRDEPQVPWLWLTPVLAGALYWSVRALHADGVAVYSSPSLVYRVLRLPDEILGGFTARSELLLLAAQVVVWLVLCRGGLPSSVRRFRGLPHAERALYLLTALCLLGYLVLPASTWTSVAINPRFGVLAFSLLPALVPARGLRALPLRASVLLVALGASAAWHTTANLVRFDAEARPFSSVLSHVPWRSKLVGLIYDNLGHVARTFPYLQFPAYAQAERGGLLALSLADFAWTVPLRRREDSPALPPPYGAEWDPAALHVQPHRFLFYDAVLVRGKEPREMTIFMETPFRLAHHSGDWLLYVR